MPDTLVKVDLSKSAYDNDMVHNRWHPDIPMVATVKPGQDFIIECYDWTGGFIKNNDDASDVRDIDLSIVHFLSGPVGVEGAEPGDLLVVDFLDIGAFHHNNWGFNGFFSKKNGGGFLTAAAAAAARTVPPREHGGNCDIKDLSRGAKVYFPVYVPGAGLSMGDLHFSQGDGEITFCGAIEMPGWIHLKVELIKGGMAKYGIKNPIFKPSVIKPNYTDYLIFEGISVDESGEQHYLDVNVAYRQACLNAIEYMKKFGYSGAQAYSILGTAPVQGHISGVVDIPNSCATLWLPTNNNDFNNNHAE